jgi:hypothetical protein
MSDLKLCELDNILRREEAELEFLTVGLKVRNCIRRSKKSNQHNLGMCVLNYLFHGHLASSKVVFCTCSRPSQVFTVSRALGVRFVINSYAMGID